MSCEVSNQIKSQDLLDLKNRARSWYEDTALYPETVLFEKNYSFIPRMLFEEVSLTMVSKRAPLVLDVSPALWVDRQQESRKFDVYETSQPLWRMSFANAPAIGKKYDVILAYSILRLMQSPKEFIQWLCLNLAPGGKCFLVDFSGDIDERLVEHVLGRVSSVTHKKYLRDQISVALKAEQIQHWLSMAGVERYRLAVGGLAGYGDRSPEFMSLLAANQNILPILMKLSQSGYRSRRAAETVFHLTFTLN